MLYIPSGTKVPVGDKSRPWKFSWLLVAATAVSGVDVNNTEAGMAIVITKIPSKLNARAHEVEWALNWLARLLNKTPKKLSIRAHGAELIRSFVDDKVCKTTARDS